MSLEKDPPSFEPFDSSGSPPLFSSIVQQDPKIELSDLFLEEQSKMASQEVKTSIYQFLVPQKGFCIDDLGYNPRNHEYMVSFMNTAVNRLKRLSLVLENHLSFHKMIASIQPLGLIEFERVFEQKLAMYIALNTINRVSVRKLYYITKKDVLNETNMLIRDVLYHQARMIPENSIRYMLDAYPVTLLSTICQTTQYHSYIIGESVKRFIKYRQQNKNWLPCELHNVVDSPIPLTGHPHSPLSHDELQALYRYLGTRHSIYINILLNSLFELHECDKVFTTGSITEAHIISLCKSAWLYLFLFPLDST
jgi:hypothetical protein